MSTQTSHRMKMRRAKLCQAAALVAAVAAASGCLKRSVSGHITDCRGTSPLEGADVQLTSRSPDVSWEAAQTASDGAYSFQVDDPPKALPVTLTAAKRGFQTVQKTYSEVPGPQDICMQPTTR
jgi:hypothetical protein